VEFFAGAFLEANGLAEAEDHFGSGDTFGKDDLGFSNEADAIAGYGDGGSGWKTAGTPIMALCFFAGVDVGLPDTALCTFMSRSGSLHGAAWNEASSSREGGRGLCCALLVGFLGSGVGRDEASAGQRQLACALGRVAQTERSGVRLLAAWRMLAPDFEKKSFVK